MRVLEIIVSCLAVAVFYWYICKRLLRQLHMAQQNSYRPERFMRWLKARFGSELLKRDLLAAIVLAIVGFVTDSKLVMAIAGVVVFGLLLITWKRPVEKKPLVFTARAKRLYATDVVLCIILVSLIMSIPVLERQVNFAALGLLAFFLPFVQYIATVVAKPNEERINRGFVNDAKRILDELPFLTRVGITGSYGKTSSKVILGRVLAEHLHTLVTPDSYNTPMGVTITVRNQLKPVHEVFVVEMGARQSGDIAELCELAHPTIGIVTAIGPQHLETFGSVENVAKTKFELIDSLPADGLAVLNLDDAETVKRLHTVKVPIVTYALDNVEVNGVKADYWADEIGFSAAGMSFTLHDKDGEAVVFRTALLGRHNIHNILAAVAVARHLGMDYRTISRAVAAVPPVPHRLVLTPAGGFSIIDDAFNSNPVGSAQALEVLHQMPGGKKIVVTPGMVELGAKEYELNYAFAQKCAELCDYVIIVGRKHSAALQEGVKSVGIADDAWYVAADLNDALAKMRAVVAPGDYVLLENDLPDSYL